MIQELRIKNFLSFRDEVVLNFEATRDRTFEECQVVSVTPKVRLLRFMLVYGANASGKTNLLKALDYLRHFLFAIKSDIDETTGVTPFLLDRETPGQASEFNLLFYVGEKKYSYFLKLTKRSVEAEELYVYNSLQPSNVFKRTREGSRSVVSFNEKLVRASKLVVEQLNLRCLPNMSFFAARNQVNCSLAYVDEVRDWMRNKLQAMIIPGTNMFDYAGRKLEKDVDLKEYILDFVRRADFNISGVFSEKEKVLIPQSVKNDIETNTAFSEEFKKSLLSESSMERLRTDFEHTVKNSRGVETYILSDGQQSSGTKRTLGIETAIYETLKEDRVLAIDEIETSLHPELVEFMIQKFLSVRNRSQMIVSSHYDLLLNTVDDLIRKDMVWFTEKGEDGNTSLYSLTDFRGNGRISSFQRAYRNGVFGALPNIKG